MGNLWNRRANGFKIRFVLKSLIAKLIVVLSAVNSSEQFEPGGPSSSLWNVVLNQEVSIFLKALCIRSQTGLNFA